MGPRPTRACSEALDLRRSSSCLQNNGGRCSFAVVIQDGDSSVLSSLPLTEKIQGDTSWRTSVWLTLIWGVPPACLGSR